LGVDALTVANLGREDAGLNEQAQVLVDLLARESQRLCNVTLSGKHAADVVVVLQEAMLRDPESVRTKLNALTCLRMNQA
jgi:hypothetical protein